ncbi:protein of unknown function [Streptomyces sp. KY70]|nr:protein of unknown function [Streptomyces sp. KY70]
MPDGRRERVSVDLLLAAGAEHLLELALGVGLVVVQAEHADRRRELRGVTDEPGGLVAVRRTRLPRRLTSLEPCGLARAVLHHVLQHVRDVVRDDCAEGALGLLLVLEDGPAVLLHLGDGVRGVLLAARGEGGVGTGHTDGTGRGRTDGERRNGGVRHHAVVLQAGEDGGFLDLVRPDVHTELDEGGVGRLLHGVPQVDLAVVVVTVVGLEPLVVVLVLPDLAVVLLDLELVVAVVDALRRDEGALGVVLVRPELRVAYAVPHRRGQDEGLPRRADLGAGGVRVVGEVLRGVLPAVRGEDGARLGVHRGTAELHVGVRLRTLLGTDLGLVDLVHRFGELVHLRLVEGGVDLEAAELHVLGLDVLGVVGEEVLTRQLHQVAGLSTQLGVLLRRHGLGELLVLRPLLRRHLAVLDLLVKDPLPALLGAFAVLRRGRALGVDVGGAGRVVVARPLEERRQEGALARVQVRGVLVVVRTGRGLQTGGTSSVVGDVEVAGHDRLLLLLPSDLEGDEELFELPRERLVLVEPRVLHVLLGDGRTTLGLTARGHVEHRTADALGVDALVRPEALVLGRDHGVAHRHGDLLVADLLTVGHTAGRHHLVAVGPVVDVVLRLGGILDPRLVDQGVRDACHAHQHAEEAHAEARDELPRGQPATESVPAVPRVVDQALLAGRSGVAATAGPPAAPAALSRTAGLGTAAVRALLALRLGMCHGCSSA